ncbi:hypothetical protein Glove_29g178 [Diversispora epigaea]|uniref:Uncharacterized protein n=1 Tax=Diversispora epigaea TaxID=1348612 RepID=A0A397JKN8_9GLOM|nr:hypothetical protein Glove_29g178 [Diversispora epigaea]
MDSITIGSSGIMRAEYKYVPSRTTSNDLSIISETTKQPRTSIKMARTCEKSSQEWYYYYVDLMTKIEKATTSPPSPTPSMHSYLISTPSDADAKCDQVIEITLSELEHYIHGPFTSDLSTSLSKFLDFIKKMDGKMK